MTRPLRLETLSRTKASREIFLRLFAYLAEAEPRVSVTEDIVAEFIEELHDAILEGTELHWPCGVWWLMFDHLGPPSDQAFCCGTAILEFVGLVGEAAQHNRIVIPIIWAANALALCQRRLPCNAVKWHRSRNGCRYLEVTATGVQALGISGKVALPKSMPHAETVQELLEQLPSPHL
ncbi:hypothetical protein JNW90_33600 [Micromonospora sp. STR1s_5]|nr:hypothetical protein [Micromonospora sp. STR1s_5]